MVDNIKVDNTAILAVVEALGESLAAHKNFEEDIKEHGQQLFEQNEMLRKEVRDLKALIAKKDEEIKALDMQSKAILDATGAKVEETYADEDCTLPRTCKAEEIPHSPYGVAECCTPPPTTVDTNSYANEANCENCDG